MKFLFQGAADENFLKFRWFLCTFKVIFKIFSPFRVGPPFPPWCHVWARISPRAHLAGFRLRFLFLSNFSILKKSRRIPVLWPHRTCVNYQFFQFSELQTRKDGNAKFYVRSCFDVFFEELSFGNRQQLAKLESIGRRFRVVIDQKFGVTPFLRLNLTWYSIFEI